VWCGEGHALTRILLGMRKHGAYAGMLGTWGKGAHAHMLGTWGTRGTCRHAGHMGQRGACTHAGHMLGTRGTCRHAGPACSSNVCWSQEVTKSRGPERRGPESKRRCWGARPGAQGLLECVATLPSLAAHSCTSSSRGGEGPARRRCTCPQKSVWAWRGVAWPWAWPCCTHVQAARRLLPFASMCRLHAGCCRSRACAGCKQAVANREHGGFLSFGAPGGIHTGHAYRACVQGIQGIQGIQGMHTGHACRACVQGIQSTQGMHTGHTGHIGHAYRACIQGIQGTQGMHTGHTGHAYRACMQGMRTGHTGHTGLLRACIHTGLRVVHAGGSPS